MGKTALEELQQFIADDRLRDPEMQAALRAQGIDVSGLDAGDAADSADNAGTETLDAESPDAALAQLQRASDTLVQTHQERLDRDRLKQEDSWQAAQQRAADNLQQTLGTVQKLRQDTTGNVRTRVNAFADRLGNVPSPGGLGVPLIILAALLIFLIPVLGRSGESEPRFIWAWLVLTRKARLIAESEAAPGAHEKTTTTVLTSNGTHETQNGNSATDAASILALPPLNTSNFSRYFQG